MVKPLYNLPEPHTDFIYSVISEETGLVGATIILVCFALIVWRGLRTSLRAPDQFAALTALGNGGLDVLIGSTILDVGVDVPSVGMIVLAGGGKAEVATRQRIGRGLREKKSGGPNVAFIVDAADDHNNHIKGHYLQRRGIVKSTPGFAENVVEDFDFKARLEEQNEELEILNAEARELEARIAENVSKLLEEE